MANISSYGELHDELWESSDLDELFAQVPSPDMPELDDAPLTIHSAVESAKACYPDPDGAPAHGPECRFLMSCDRVADQCCAECIHTHQY